MGVAGGVQDSGRGCWTRRQHQSRVDDLVSARCGQRSQRSPLSRIESGDCSRPQEGRELIAAAGRLTLPQRQRR